MDYYAASITQIKKQTFDNNLRDPPRFLHVSITVLFLNKTTLLDFNYFLSFLYSSFITQVDIPKHQFKSFYLNIFSIFTPFETFFFPTYLWKNISNLIHKVFHRLDFMWIVR